MNAEFNVWLLIVGLVVGAGLAWLVMMDSRRRDAEIDAAELPREAAWLAAVMAEDGYDISPDAAEQLLLLHRAYLGAPPPDPLAEDGASATEDDLRAEARPTDEVPPAEPRPSEDASATAPRPTEEAPPAEPRPSEDASAATLQPTERVDHGAGEPHRHVDRRPQ